MNKLLKQVLPSLISLSLTFGEYHFSLIDRCRDLFDQSRVESELEQRSGIAVIGDTSKAHLSSLAMTLDETSKHLDYFDEHMKKVKSIGLYSKNLWSWLPIESLNNSNVYGSAGPNGGIKLFRIDDDIFLHELSHIWHRNHPDNKQLDDDWKKELQIEDSVSEDIAYFAGEVYRIKSSNIHPSLPISESKLELLVKYGFFSPREQELVLYSQARFYSKNH